jgi:hypothetical protein
MPGDTYDPKTAMGTIVDRSQFDRVNEYINIGKSEGAIVHTGGTPVEPVKGGIFIPPTIFKGVKPGMRIEQEEIFGPATKMQCALQTTHSMALVLHYGHEMFRRLTRLHVNCVQELYGSTRLIEVQSQRHSVASSNRVRVVIAHCTQSRATPT